MRGEFERISRHNRNNAQGMRSVNGNNYLIDSIILRERIKCGVVGNGEEIASLVSGNARLPRLVVGSTSAVRLLHPLNEKLRR